MVPIGTPRRLPPPVPPYYHPYTTPLFLPPPITPWGGWNTHPRLEPGWNSTPFELLMRPGTTLTADQQAVRTSHPWSPHDWVAGSTEQRDRCEDRFRWRSVEPQYVHRGVGVSRWRQEASQYAKCPLRAPSSCGPYRMPVQCKRLKRDQRHLVLRGCRPLIDQEEDHKENRPQSTTISEIRLASRAVGAEPT